MRRNVFLCLLSFAALSFAACSGGSASQSPETSPPAAASSEDTCPVLDPGPPPKCPEGCAWNGTECRKQGGIIMPNSVDAGPAGTQ